MKQKKLLLIVGIIVVAALAVALGLMIYFDVGDPAAVEDTSVSYIEESAWPSSVAITNETGSYTVVPKEGQPNDDTEWVVSGLESVPIYTEQTRNIASQMKSLRAQKIFMPEDELSSYGLDAPAATVTASYQDGDQNILKIGGKNPEKTGYYCQLNEQHEVGLVLISDIQYYLNDQEELIDLTLVSYTQTTADDGSELPGVQSCTLTRSDLAQPIEISRDENQTLQITSGPAGLTLNDDNRTLVENAISALTAESAEVLSPTQEQLTQFGLTQPQATVTYVINNETVTLQIGNVSHTSESLTSDGSTKTTSEYYVMVKDRPVVYSVEDTALPWLTINFS